MNPYEDIPDEYVDPWGMITQRGGDGGDSAQRLGMYYFAVYLGLFEKRIDADVGIKKLVEFLVSFSKLIETDRNTYLMRRHPNSAEWYGKWDRFSRDQYTPILIALGCVGGRKMILRLLYEHLMRFGFMTNTKGNGEIDMPEKVADFALGPEFIGLYIRALRVWWLYPLLFISDLETLIGSIIWRFRSDEKSTDILNHVCVCIYGAIQDPTPLNWLARKILPAEMVQRKLWKYFSNGGPPMDKIYKPFVWSYFG